MDKCGSGVNCCVTARIVPTHRCFRYASIFTATPTYPECTSLDASDVATKYRRSSSICHAAVVLNGATTLSTVIEYGR